MFSRWSKSKPESSKFAAIEEEEAERAKLAEIALKVKQQKALEEAERKHNERITNMLRERIDCGIDVKSHYFRFALAEYDNGWTSNWLRGSNSRYEKIYLELQEYYKKQGCDVRIFKTSQGKSCRGYISCEFDVFWKPI